jgi:hypothetical protein
VGRLDFRDWSEGRLGDPLLRERHKP